eukprot:gene162-4390_t
MRAAALAVGVCPAAATEAPLPAGVIRAPSTAPLFSATGRCTVSGDCALSPNHPSDYSDDEDCTITALRGGLLDVRAFDTEDGYDLLTVAGRQYSGGSGPAGVPLATSDNFTWHSDGGGERTGWKVCLLGGATAAPRTSDVTIGGCHCNASWVAGGGTGAVCARQGPFHGCRDNVPPCDGDYGGVPGQTWCMIEPGCAGAPGGFWDYCVPPFTGAPTIPWCCDMTLHNGDHWVDGVSGDTCEDYVSQGWCNDRATKYANEGMEAFQ